MIIPFTLAFFLKFVYPKHILRRGAREPPAKRLTGNKVPK
jgi:hypothetical protein